jgi:activator of HSP90 ATPase
MKTSTIRQSVYINAPPEKVYEAYVNPRLHAQFTGAKATGSGKVGSKMTAWDGYCWGKLLRLQKGKLIVQEWMDSDWPSGYDYSKLKIELRKKGKGTQLTMTQRKVPPSRTKDLFGGWQEFYWKPLREFFS